MEKKQKGFTLIEILVSVVIIATGASFLAGMFATGRYFIQQSRNKAIAMSIAAHRLDQWQARSYTSLSDAVVNPNNYNLGGQEARGVGGKNFNWQVNLTQSDMRADTGLAGVAPVPFILVEIEVTYPEDTILKKTIEKTVNLTGYKPYPYTHIENRLISGVGGTAIPTSLTNTYTSCVNDVCGGNDALEVSFSYPVEKDVKIIYNIALDVVNAAGVGSTDTIYTQCFLWENGVPVGPIPIETRTPIVSQPHIANIAAITNMLTRGRQYTVGIRWYKDTAAGVVRVDSAELITIATEAE